MTTGEKYIQLFLQHLKLKRNSPRTSALYEEVLKDYFSYCDELSYECIRAYQMHIMDDLGYSAKTVNLHLSALSSLCTFLVNSGEIESNPMKSIKRPKNAKRLPVFYRKEEMDEYVNDTQVYASEEFLQVFEHLIAEGNKAEAKRLYEKRLGRVLVMTLYSLGVRRAELISLDRSSLDFSRGVVNVRGKGDKMREIPMLEVLSREILLYLKSVDALGFDKSESGDALFLTFTGARIYPVLVDRLVKSELGSVKSIKGRKSPHVLRHTVATQLLNEGSDLNSIKEFLGHSSLAATQVYTHNSIAKLKQIYESAHPRAKKDGNYGD